MFYTNFFHNNNTNLKFFEKLFVNNHKFSFKNVEYNIKNGQISFFNNTFLGFFCEFKFFEKMSLK